MSLESCWKVFVQPPKQSYTQYDLGPTHYKHGDMQVARMEFATRNKRGLMLRGSFYQVSTVKDCVLYMHSFNGSKVEAVQLAQVVTESGVNFCMFDFSAAGLSEGTYVTFGAHEQYDVLAIKKYLEEHYGIQRFILWGRSMGATTSLLHAIQAGTSDIAGLILDSPFHDLNKLTIRMVQKQYSFPKLIIKGLLSVIRRQIESAAKFQFDEVRLPSNIKVTVPALFLASKSDTVIPYKYTQKVFHAYQGTKTFIELSCDHNENRSEQVLQGIIEWISQQVTRPRSITTKSLSPQLKQTNLISRVPEGSKIKERITRNTNKVFRPQIQLSQVNHSINFEHKNFRLTPKLSPVQRDTKEMSIDHIKRKYAYLLQRENRLPPQNPAQKLKNNIQRELSPDVRVVNRFLLKDDLN